VRCAACKAWGVKLLLQTNAAGSLRPHMPPGSLMLITDHINAPQRSPLVGESGNARFVDMGAAYDPELLAHARQMAQAKQVALTRAPTCGRWARSLKPRPRSACLPPGAPTPWA
jgi:purine-nucleoside phosphorylase